MIASSYKLYVSYNQIAVFASDLEQPFNDWTDQQVLKGFSWRENSVSFRTLVEEATHQIDVVTAINMPTIPKEAIRAIEVPFESPANGKIEVASISDSIALSLPAGKYALRYELLGQDSNSDHRIRLTFAKTASGLLMATR
jgi:hypothetical protein